MAPDVAEDFWRSTRLLALSLDDDKRTVRLDIDAATFADPVWLAMVRADLASDGAKVEWSIPVGCRDPITGKARLPHLGCPKGWELVEVSPGAFMCRQTSTGRMSAPNRVCDGAPVVVRDPITDMKDSIVKGALILGFLWLVSRRSVGNR